MEFEQAFLESEIIQIKEIIAMIPPEELLDRLSFETRLAKVERSLVDYMALMGLPARTERYVGEIVGVLPQRRTFEFQIAGGDLIYGNIDEAVGDPSVLTREWLHRPVVLTLQLARSEYQFTLCDVSAISPATFSDAA